MRSIIIQCRAIPKKNMIDDNFRRLNYVRYADDFIIGIIGPHSRAVAVLEVVKSTLDKVGLSLNEKKTRIVHGYKGTSFLSADIKVPRIRRKVAFLRLGKKVIGFSAPFLTLNVPRHILLLKLQSKGFVKFKNGKFVPTTQTKYLNYDHADILRFFNRIIHGILNYYSFATDFKKLRFVV